MHIPRLPLPPRGSITLRHLSTRPPPPPAHQPPPTSFTAKASPRQTLSHPEELRGMPPLTPRTAVNKGKIDIGERGKGRDEKEVFEAFEGPSRPRLIYERPGGRELPKVRGTAPFVIALGLLGLGWGLFILHATNSERLSSSVLRQATFQLRNSKEVIALLGENVRLVDEWWALGSPWISGTLSTNTRSVRYKVIADDGQVIRLEDQAIRPEQKSTN
ncbi:hypothetical protein D1P53_003647 [Cryptococcus gattii VGV]|nr:hypothetical protein D1P53_003647 [Cryptococcus gattii VGV]